MHIIKLLSFLLLRPACAEVSVSTSVVVPMEVDSRDAKFESDIAEAEKRINELARQNRLSNEQKASLYREEAKKTLSLRDSKQINKLSKLMSSKEKAIVFFTKEIELNPNPQAYHLRGVTYQELRQYNNAIKDFTAAIQFKDQTAKYPYEYSKAEAYRLRGMTYKMEKDYPKALADVNAAIELNPRDVGYSYGDRCDIYLKMGRIKEAAKDAKAFFQSPRISKRDKENFSKSGQCQDLAEAGIHVDGCKDLAYFKEWEQKFLNKTKPSRKTLNNGGK